MKNIFFIIFCILFFNYSVASSFEEIKSLLTKSGGEITPMINVTKKNPKDLRAAIFNDASTSTEKPSSRNGSFAYDPNLLSYTPPNKIIFPARTTFSESQRNKLKRQFAKEKTPDMNTREKIAEDLGVKCTAVTNWFQNMRRLEKKRGTENSKLPIKGTIEDKKSSMGMSESTDDETFNVDAGKSFCSASLKTLMVKSKYTKGQEVPVIYAISHLVSLITTIFNPDNFYINTKKYRKMSNGEKKRVTRALEPDEFQENVLRFLNNEHSKVDYSIRVLRGRTDKKGNIINHFNIEEFKKQIVGELELLAIADISQLSSEKEVDVFLYLLHKNNKKFNKFLLPLLEDYKKQLEDPDRLQSLIKNERDLPNISNLREAAYEIYLEQKAKRDDKRQLMLDSVQPPPPLSEPSDVSDNEAIDEDGMRYPLPDVAAFETAQ